MQNGNPTAALAGEFVGTFFLVFVGAGSIIMNHFTGGELGLVGIALAHGLALSIAVTATMNISGGHINPAVTFGMWVTRKIEARLALFYGVAQIAGGVLAGLLLLLFFPTEAGEAVALGTPALAAGIGFGQAIGIELILTFLLMFSIFGTAVDPRAPNVGGFGIGLAVTFDILAGGPLTGAAMNPARFVGTALPAWTWDAHLVYWIGPIIGAVLAALVYDRFILSGAEEEDGFD